MYQYHQRGISLGIVRRGGCQLGTTGLHGTDPAATDAHRITRAYAPGEALVVGIIGQNRHQTVQIGRQVVAHIALMLIQTAVDTQRLDRNGTLRHRHRERLRHILRMPSCTRIRVVLQIVAVGDAYGYRGLTHALSAGCQLHATVSITYVAHVYHIIIRCNGQTIHAFIAGR